MSEIKTIAEKKARLFIIGASLFIPIAVAILYVMPKIGPEAGQLRDMLNKLPALNSLINGATAVILVMAVLAIRNKNVVLHRRLMTSALGLSVVFLLSYIGYHATSETTPFPKDAPFRGIYLFVLLTHIVISAIIVPLVLITYSRALAEKFDKHRKIAKLTFPLWLYVTVTGVIVYFMISPYYAF
jgi:putative membrane protein